MADRQPHVFYPDPQLRRDWWGQSYCSTCGLPKRNPVHEVDGTPDEAVEQDARRLGEHSSEEEESE